MSRLALYLLGPPRLELDGEEIHISRRKAMALLAYLAVTGQPHSRDSLATLLWPYSGQSGARAELRRILSVLSRTLGKEWLAVDRETAGLNPDAALWLDVEVFRQRLAPFETHGHPPTEACPDCLPLLEEAVRLYQDDFLAGFTLRDSAAFDEWQFFQTEGLKDQLAGALVRLANYHTSQGDFEPAIGYARRWLALDPLNEAAHRHLMVLYAQSNQRAAALRQHEICRQLLADELGVEPAERTQETYERLLKGELPVGPTAVEAILERELRTVGECPYRGLAPFREADAAFFFGRGRFTERLAQAVRTRPMVAVIVGSSGSGKSSAVFAGLLPRLREEGDWLIAHFRPGAQPFHALAAALLPLLERDQEPELSRTDRLIETRKLAQALSEGTVPLSDVAAEAVAEKAGASRLLLLIDQFEELYTLCAQSELRRQFLDGLLQAVGTVSERRDSPFVLLLTMRADFMGQAVAYRPFADALQEAALIMGPMTREELRAAIERPAETQGAALEAGLVERLLDDVGEEPGNLPLLEFALTLLWERLDYGWMTHAAYEEIGRVEGALARYAEEVYGELAEREREGARRIFVQLVQPGEGTEDTRRVATRAELGEENWPLVQHLADRRLVVTGRDPTTGRETVEVVHEALIQRWDQLRGWMEEDRAFRTWQERLRGTLNQWEVTGQDEGVLLRGVPLAEAEGWLAEREAELSTGEGAFIQASVELRERRETERGRRRRRIFVGLAAGLIVALVLALLAVFQWQRAEDEEQQALIQAAIGLASQAALELEGDYPERAVLLALEALENYPYTWQAERALGQAVLSNRLRLLLQHEKWVITVQWSSDGTRILTASGDGTAKVWDAITGEELLTLSGHQDWVVSTAWSPSGDRIVTASWDGTAKVWDAITGEELLTFDGHRGALSEAEWSPDGARVATIGGDGKARVWNATTGKEMFSLTADVDPHILIGGVTWSPDGSRIATAGEDGIAGVWDATTGEELSTLYHGDILQDPTWSPDGTRVATASWNDTAKVWDATTGEALLTLHHTRDVRSATWSPSGETIISTDEDGNAKIWDAATGDELHDLYPADYTSVVVAGAVWSPSGERVVTFSWDGTTTVWDAATGAEILALVGHAGGVDGAAWSPSGDRIATCGEDGTAKVWDVASGPELLTLSVTLSPGAAGVLDAGAEWSPSGDHIVTSSWDETVEVWDTVTGAKLVTLFLSQEVADAAWSPSGEQIATGGSYAKITVSDAATGDTTLDIAARTGSQVHDVSWSPAGERIAATSWNGIAKVFDATTGEELLTLAGRAADQIELTVHAWSPSGDRIVTASHADGTANVWDAATGDELLTLATPKGRIYVALWSADGMRIITYSEGDVGKVWNATNGEELVTFTGHTGLVRGMSPSPTGDRVVTSSYDGTARVWDMNTGAELARYSLGGMVYSVDWSPDGTRIVVSMSDGTAKVLPAWQTTQELIDHAKDCCVVRELTAEEREMFGLPPR